MVIIGGTSHMLVPVGLEIVLAVLVVIHGCNLWFNMQYVITASEIITIQLFCQRPRLSANS